MAVVHERGEISSRDFGGAGQGYWDWTPAKGVLEALWTAGAAGDRRAPRHGAALRPARARPARRGARRGRAAVRGGAPMQVERAVRARGIVERGARLRLLPRQGQAAHACAGDRGARASGVLERVRMRELGDAWLVPAEDADRAIAGDDRPTGAFLLVARSTTCCGIASRPSTCSASSTRSRSTSRRPRASRATTCCRCSTAPRSSAAST